MINLAPHGRSKAAVPGTTSYMRICGRGKGRSFRSHVSWGGARQGVLESIPHMGGKKGRSFRSRALYVSRVRESFSNNVLYGPIPSIA